MKLTLAELAARFNQKNVYTQLIPRSEQVPLEQLVVLLGQDHKGRNRQLEMMFIPDIEGMELLQLFVIVPCEIKETALSDLARFLFRINERVPLVGFSLSEQKDWVYYRCLIPSMNQELNADVVLRSTWLINFLLHQFGELIEQVAEGTVSLTEATERLRSIGPKRE